MHTLTHKHLILIGMMGSGKSSVARLIALQHDLPLVDTDHEIEKDSGCSIPELFSSKGEAAFREMEHEQLKKILQTASPSVLSTGGGIVVTEKNRALLRDSGFVVYLKAEPTTLLQRVSHDSNRPLLKEGDPLQTLTRLLQQREVFYEQAHLTLQVDHMNCRQVAARIWSHFSKRRG